ncbi:hypothetical protein [Pseudomonas sp. OV226]|uniref:hypothetical protein n=1 Tax=Pseudomonas sp. OV226 TaxID=2135588 RepID=UPI000D6CAA7C|nr:hypothetical protein [Pseudomonas sp. OV226]PWK31781.1 hypothetical protein C7534_12240 [Pseudomonas sp. OV226]
MTKPVNVQKATPTILYAKQAPYSSVSNDVVAMIVNPDALAIWAYLQTRSSDWKVIGSHLQERFAIGRDRYSKAMACLKELGLVSHEVVREEGTGKVLGRRVIVHYEPNLQVSEYSVSRSVGSPKCGETGNYLIKDSITQSIEKEPTVADAPSAPKKKALRFNPLTAKPANASDQAWADFCEMRKAKRAPLTLRACELIAKKLANHSEPDAVLDKSTTNSWSDIYPESILPGAGAKNGKSSSYTNLPTHTPDMYQEATNGPAF